MHVSSNPDSVLSYQNLCNDLSAAIAQDQQNEEAADKVDQEMENLN